MSNYICIRAIRQHPAPGRTVSIGRLFHGLYHRHGQQTDDLGHMVRRGRSFTRQPRMVHCGVCGRTGPGSAGVRARPARGHGPATLQPLRPGEAVHLWLPQRDTLLPAPDAECRRNVELFLLLNRLCPDFRTIADFRKRHGKLLKKIFLIFVQACRK